MAFVTSLVRRSVSHLGRKGTAQDQFGNQHAVILRLRPQTAGRTEGKEASRHLSEAIMRIARTPSLPLMSLRLGRKSRRCEMLSTISSVVLVLDRIYFQGPFCQQHHLRNLIDDIGAVPPLHFSQVARDIVVHIDGYAIWSK